MPLRELLGKPGQDLSFPEKIGIIVDREWNARENRKLTRLLRSAKLGVDACIEDVWCTPERGLAFLIAPLKEAECRDLLEVLEDRYGKSSTVTSQIPTEKWHAGIADPTIADAICDRLVHNAHVLSLKGPSIRKVKGDKKSTRQQPTT